MSRATALALIIAAAGHGVPMASRLVHPFAAARAQSADPVAPANAPVEALSRAGDECAVLVGLPSATQRSRVARACRGALADLARAERQVAARIDALAATDPAEARRLAETELGLRIPLLRARAMVLSGVAERSASTLSGAIEHLQSIDPVSVAPAALRRYLLAVALFHRDVFNGATPGNAGPDSTEAIDLLRSIGDWPIGTDPHTQHPPALAADVKFAMIRIGTHVRGDNAIALRAGEWEDQPPFVIRAGGDQSELAEPGLFVRHAEARAAALAGLWVARPGKVTFDQLVSPINQSVQSWRVTVPGDTRNREAVARQRAAQVRESLIGKTVASILEAGGSQLELPPWAVVAGAAELARDPQTRETASIILEALLRRKDLGDATADALFYSAMTLADSDRARDVVEAVRRATRAVESGLKEPRRSVLLAGLPAVAAQALKRAEAVNPPDTRLAAEAAEVRIAALRAAGRADPGQRPAASPADLARAILRRPGSAQVQLDGRTVTVNRIDASTLIEALEAIGTPADAASRALALGAIEASIAWGRALVTDSANPQADGQNLVRAAEAALAFVGDTDRALAARLRIARADGYAAAADPRAVDLYDQLLAVEPPPTSPALLMIAKARAQRACGQATGAFATLRTLTDLYDAAPGEARPAEYFVAWAEMLEVLAADNARSQRSEQIRLRIAALRAMDPDLGTPLAAERIDMVLRSLR